MIGEFVSGRRGQDPVLIVTFLNGTPEPKVVVIHADGSMKAYPLSEVSADWHYNAEKSQFEPDFVIEG